ncbi:MAG: hypothetical protein ACK2UM_04255 [Anaerolineales bacterium]
MYKVDMANAPFSRSLMLLFPMLILLGCTYKDVIEIDSEYSEENGEMYNHLTIDTAIRDIVNHPAFEGFGELLLPRDDSSSYYDTQLRNVGSFMPYHSYVEPDIVIDAINHMIDDAKDGKKIILRYLFRRAEDHRSRKKEYRAIFLPG